MTIKKGTLKVSVFYRRSICASLFLALAMLTGQFATADTVVLADHSFEPLAIEMDFFGTYGDQDATFYGTDSINPRTGTDHLWTDLGNNGNGAGFGGNYSGVTADVVNFGPLEYGSYFQMEAYVALDTADPASNGFFELVLDFFDASDDIIIGASAIVSYDTSTFSSNYGLVSLDYTLNAVDLPDLSSVVRIEGGLNSDSNSNAADGRLFVDDFRFTYTTPVPEPTTSSALALLMLCGLAFRRRS